MRAQIEEDYFSNPENYVQKRGGGNASRQEDAIRLQAGNR
jgi:hypothetical protein